MARRMGTHLPRERAKSSAEEGAAADRRLKRRT
jgi:hypothetical protein